MSWLTVSNAFSASTVRSSKSRLNFLYINIVSDAINAVNLLDACSVKPLCKGFCVGDSCFSNRSLMTDSIIFENVYLQIFLKRNNKIFMSLFLFSSDVTTRMYVFSLFVICSRNVDSFTEE